MKTRRELRCWIALVALSSGAQAPGPQAELDDLLKSGATLNRQADFEHAIPLLRRAISLSPLNPSANFLLGTALFESGHPADAIAPLRIAAMANPVNETAEGYLGDAEMELNEFGFAADTFQTAVARSPGSEQALMWWTDFSLERYRSLMFSLRASVKGRSALLQVAAEDDKTNLTDRERWLRQAASLNPSLSGIWGELGVAEGQAGMAAGAEASLQAAKKWQPRASSTLELESLVDAAHGNWSETDAALRLLKGRSEGEFRRFLTAWPRKLAPNAEDTDAPWACLRDGSTNCAQTILADEQPDLPSAQQIFEEGRWEQITAGPPPPEDDSSSWFWRGSAFLALRDCSRAIPALERGLKPGAETAAAQLAHCYESEAIGAADRLKAQGRDGAVHQIRGDILLSIRLDPAKAATEYAEALKLKPNDPELLEKIAEAHFSLGEMTLARENAQAALDQNPRRPQVLRLLVRIAMSDRDYAGALALLGQLARIEPEDAWTRIQQGTAYAQIGRAEDAVQRLNPALDAGYPDEKGALHALLAGQLRKLGRNEEAGKAANEAIRLADAFQRQNQATQTDHQ